VLARVTRLARIYGRLQLLHLRAQLEYEADFWLGILGTVLRHASGFAFLWAVFRQVPQVSGWTLWELVFLYSLAIIPMGLVELFYDGPWRLPELVNEGELDRLLLRPLPAALQVVTQVSSIHGAGSVLLGLVMLVRAVAELDLALAPWQYAFLGACLLGSMLLIGSLNLLAQCVVFWEPATTQSLPVLVQEMMALARYPLSLYGRALQGLITWVLPLGFISYFPATVLLRRPEAHPWLGYGAPLAGWAVTLVAAWVWSHCLKR
jgi:ABC-2 type transport system permease protein